MRIVVAMSGGVDSSVAAALLAEQGHEVIGVSMQLYDQSEGQTSFGSCCSIDDLHDARRVAAAINIPHYIMNFERQFDEQVMSNFVREYSAGRTPLPCARCNSDLKFATLAERARGFDADLVATGHYARVERRDDGRYLLKRGVDRSKDQAYFLFSLTQDQLAVAMFPVGDRPKDVVRDYARRLGLRSRREAGQPGDLLHPRSRLRRLRLEPRARRRPTRRHRRRAWPRAGRTPGHPPLHRGTAEGAGSGDIVGATGAPDVRAGRSEPPTVRSSSDPRRRSSERR